MPTKKQEVISEMVQKYRRVLKLSDAKLWAWLTTDFGKITSCPCCAKYNSSGIGLCGGCPARVAQRACFAQQWWLKLAGYRQEIFVRADTHAQEISLFRSGAPKVRQLLRERLAYWKDKAVPREEPKKLSRKARKELRKWDDYDYREDDYDV